MTADGSIHGRFTAAGDPVADADALAFEAGQPPPLVATAPTDADGRFTLQGAVGAADVLARSRRGVLVATSAPAAAEVDLAVPGPLCRLRLTAVWPEDDPPMTLFLDPEALDGVPERLVPFLTQVSTGVFSSHFAAVELTGGEVTVTVQAGTWRVGGARVVYERPMMIAPAFQNLRVAGARLAAGGSPLEGKESLGFLVQVDGDLEVALDVRVVEDAELG